MSCACVFGFDADDVHDPSSPTMTTVQTLRKEGGTALSLAVAVDLLRTVRDDPQAVLLVCRQTFDRDRDSRQKQETKEGAEETETEKEKEDELFGVLLDLVCVYDRKGEVVDAIVAQLLASVVRPRWTWVSDWTDCGVGLFEALATSINVAPRAAALTKVLMHMSTREGASLWMNEHGIHELLFDAASKHPKETNVVQCVCACIDNVLRFAKANARVDHPICFTWIEGCLDMVSVFRMHRNNLNLASQIRALLLEIDTQFAPILDDLERMTDAECRASDPSSAELRRMEYNYVMPTQLIFMAPKDTPMQDELRRLATDRVRLAILPRTMFKSVMYQIHFAKEPDKTWAETQDRLYRDFSQITTPGCTCSYNEVMFIGNRYTGFS